MVCGDILYGQGFRLGTNRTNSNLFNQIHRMHASYVYLILFLVTQHCSADGFGPCGLDAMDGEPHQMVCHWTNHCRVDLSVNTLSLLQMMGGIFISSEKRTTRLWHGIPKKNHGTEPACHGLESHGPTVRFFVATSHVAKAHLSEERDGPGAQGCRGAARGMVSW